MGTRPELETFLDAVCDALIVRGGVSPDGARIAQSVRRAPRLRGAVNPVQLPGCAFLAEAVSNAQDAADPVIGDLAGMVEALSPMLEWMPRTGLAGVADDFPLRHANAVLVGSNGLDRADVTVGVTVMGPDVLYADHHHPPEEAYLVLSPGEWRQNSGPWHEPGRGGVVYNPAGITHSMRSGRSPLLAIWLLKPVPVS